MRRIITFLIAATAIVAVTWWAAGLPGTVGLNVGSVAVSAPTPVALLFAVVLFIALYLLIRFISLVIRLPGRTRRMRAERNRSRGDTAVTRTLLALAGGDPDAARTEAQRGRALLGDTPQTLLLAAYAARQAGDETKAEEVFNELAARKDAAFLGLRGLLQGALARNDIPAAQALADRAAAINPDAPWLRAERERLAIQSGSWKDALALAGRDTSVAALGTAAAEAEPDVAAARRLAQRAWKADPSFAPAALAYARRLREAGREKKAQDVLRESWTRAPHPALGAFSLAGGGFMSKEGRAAWLTERNPAHVESSLLRAEASLEAGSMAQARHYAEAARDGGLDERRVWLLLSAVAEREGDADGAAEYLSRASTASPDPHWRCEACGTVHEEWHPVCDRCGSAGRITWGNRPVAPPAVLGVGMDDALLG